MDEVKIRVGLDTGNLPAESVKAAQALKSIGVAGEISARQTANAMRLLPAQLTDVVTQLQMGANPLTILIQQGGQVKDMFGGIGPALRAVGSLITPTVAVFGGIAAVAGTIAVAFKQGASESKELRDALALTGNAAGLTGGKLASMAQQVSQSSEQTVGSSREILVELAKSGEVSSATLLSTARAVARVADVSGQDATKIAADFAKMTGGVADWAAEHNKAWNFISLEQYKYIKRLEDQGKAEEAANFVNDKVVEHLNQQAKAVGYVESAYTNATKAMSSFWESIKSLGRDETTDDKIAKVKGQLDALPAPGSGFGKSAQRDSEMGAALFGQQFGADTGVEARRAALEKDLETLRRWKSLENEWADLRSETASRNRQEIDAQRKQEKAGAPAKDRTKPYIPGEFQILDPRDAMVARAAYEKRESEIDGFFETQLQKQKERDDKRLEAGIEYVEKLAEVNAKGWAETLGDEQTRSDALIEIDRQTALRRLALMGLNPQQDEEARRQIEEAAQVSRAKFSRQQQKEQDRISAEAGKQLYQDTYNALAAAFQDTSGNPLAAFGRAVYSTIMARATAALAESFATAAVGKDGMGGVFGNFFSMLSGGFSAYDSGGYGITGGGTSLVGSGVGAAGYAGGIDYVPARQLAWLHQGERVMTAKENSADKRGSRALSVNVTNHIDARTDQAQVAQIAMAASSQGVQQAVEQMRAAGVFR